MNNLAMAYQDAHRLDDALPLYEATLKARKAVLGPNHPDTILSANNLGWAYRATGQIDKALPLFLKAAEGLERLRFQHQHAGRIINNLVECQESAEGGRQFEQAEAWRRKWLAAGKDRYGGESPGYAVLLAALGQNLLQQKKWADAEATFRACLTIREKKMPGDWQTFYTQSLIGGALLGQKKYGEAEPLLRGGYERLKGLGDKSPPACKARRKEVAERLVLLYEAMERPDDAATWKKELEALAPAAKP
jgi:tetratricopeptide (TPR) repeat protein